MVKIICEGGDDKAFLRLLLNDLKSSNDISGINNFDKYIKIMGGKEKLLNHENYTTITKDINKSINKVLFIFDCDFEEDDRVCGGLEKSTKAIENLIKKLDWNIEVNYYIFNRNLDYFLLETIKDNSCYSQFSNLTECLNIENIKPNKKPIANLYKDLYPYPQFDFKATNFNELKQKLKNLFKEENQ